MGTPLQRQTDLLQCSLHRAELQRAERMTMTDAQRQHQAYGLNQPQAFNRTVRQRPQGSLDQAAQALSQLQLMATGNALREQAAALLRVQQQQQGSSVSNTLYSTNLSTPYTQPQPPRQLTPQEIASIAAVAALSNVGISPSSRGPPPGYLPAGPSPPGLPPAGPSPPGLPPSELAPSGIYPQGPTNISGSKSRDSERAPPNVPTETYPAFGPVPNQFIQTNPNSPTWQLGEAFLPVNRQRVPHYGAGYPVFRGDSPGYWIRQYPGWRKLTTSVASMGAWKPLQPSTTSARDEMWIFTSNINVPRSPPPSPGNALIKNGQRWRIMDPTEAIPATGAWTVHGGAWTRILGDPPLQRSWVLQQQRAVAAADRALLDPGRRPTASTSVAGPSHQQLSGVPVASHS